MNTDILIGVLSRVLRLREEMWKEGKDEVKVWLDLNLFTVPFSNLCSPFVW